MVVADPDSGERVPLDIDLAKRYAEAVSFWNNEECKHERKELRRGFNKGNAPIVRHQCLDCGALVGGAVKRTPQTDMLDEINETQHPEHEAQRKFALNEIRRKYIKLQESRWRGSSEGKSYFQRSHQEYLKSSEWAERRTLVMERASGLCEGCRKAPAAEVHHLSYRNWGREFLFELVALCKACHDRVHRIGENKEERCNECIHAGYDNEWCLRFDMPTTPALDIDGPCGPHLDGFEKAE